MTFSAPFMQPITEKTTPISKAKKPLSNDEINTIRSRFSVPNWQSAGDDGVFVNTHTAAFFPTDIAMPSQPTKELEKNIQPSLKDITFTHKDGKESASLEEWVNSEEGRVQALVMAHKGKIVYEAYPGMNPSDYHIWFSTSKTAVGTMVLLLEAEGKIDMSKSVTEYATELKGTAWDAVSVYNAMNMASGLDIEETAEAFDDPNSWIEQFFDALMNPEAVKSWKPMLRDCKPLPDKKPGETFQYSTAITQVLMLVIESAANQRWVDIFNERIWSKIGARGPYMVALASDGCAVSGGCNLTTAEDMIRYALIYTPSWDKAASEQVISDKVLHKIQTMGDPKAMVGCVEEAAAHGWFGEKPERNCAQWDAVFADGAMFKHGNMHQGIYADPERDFVAIAFATCPNSRPDYNPGFMRAAAKKLAGN